MLKIFQLPGALPCDFLTRVSAPRPHFTAPENLQIIGALISLVHEVIMLMIVFVAVAF